MIVYTCPKCGRDLKSMVLTAYPPIYVTECTHCGWREEYRDKIERIGYPHEQGMTETYNISGEPVDYQDGMAQRMVGYDYQSAHALEGGTE